MQLKYLINKKHLSNLLFSCIYSLVYIFAYKYFLNTYFDYFGYIIKERTPVIWLLSLLFSVLPILYFRGYYAISSFISIFIYLILYVPTILTFTFSSGEQASKIILIQLAFAIGMCLIFYADRFTFKNANIQLSQKLPIRFFLYLTILASLFVLWIYRNNLKLVSFGDVYLQRSENENIGVDVVSRYIVSWLTSFLIPMCLAYGFTFKKYIYLLTGTIACIVIYMATAAKGTILMPFIILGTYIILIIFGTDRISKVLTYTISALIIILVIFTKPETILFVISSVFLMRTISMGGLLNVKFFDFFTTHPYTYFSHINIVGSITGSYPYGQQQLGQVVGEFFWGDKMNANANFWATDGIASFGIFGIIFISLVFYAFLILLNSLTKGYDKIFVILLSVPLTFTLLNVSFFSMLMSGGGLFMILSLVALDKNKM